MLWISPEQVTLLGVDLDTVEFVAVDRKAQRLVTEWSDIGRHAVFADVPEERVTIRIRRRLDTSIGAGFANAITPGALGAFSLRASHTTAGSANVTVSASVVVLAIEHDLSRTRGASQTITCLAVSTDGALDPFTAQEKTP